MAKEGDKLREEIKSMTARLDSQAQEAERHADPAQQLASLRQELDQVKLLYQTLSKKLDDRPWNAALRLAGKVKRHLASSWIVRRDVALVRASQVFDEVWYRNRYPDVAASKIDPIEHFVRFGGQEGRLPSPRFVSSRYLAQYPDVATACVNPLVHYLRIGKAEGRIAVSLVDAEVDRTVSVEESDLAFAKTRLRHKALTHGAERQGAGMISADPLWRHAEQWRPEREAANPAAKNNAAKLLASTPITDRSFVVHDADWQYPAITEKHAYAMAKRILPPAPGITYLAFPWATLIDRLNNKGSQAYELLEAARGLGAEAEGRPRVVTVCQHIHLPRIADLMRELGVTDVFWSHAVKGAQSLDKQGRITVRPFPLYPVQVTEPAKPADEAPRPHLFSFMGARPNQWYLTEARSWILDDLGGDPRGLVTGRESWHYQKIVYDHQINGSAVQPEAALVNEDASRQFRQILSQSVFSLCPSGSGPNSIRLWESIGAGAVPVVISDLWAPPGDHALWEEAAVFCPENREAVRVLPDRLEAIARDTSLLAHKRKAVRQLWRLYGPKAFVSDIHELYLTLTTQGGRPQAIDLIAG